MSDQQVAGKLTEIFEAVLNNIAIGKDAATIVKPTSDTNVNNNVASPKQLVSLPKYPGLKYIHGLNRPLEWIYSYNNCAFSTNVVHDIWTK